MVCRLFGGHDVAGAIDNPFAAGQGRIAGFAGPDGTEMLRMLTGPVRVGDAAQPTRAAPGLGADTDEILRRLGLGPGEIAALRDRGVV